MTVWLRSRLPKVVKETVLKEKNRRGKEYSMMLMDIFSFKWVTTPGTWVAFFYTPILHPLLSLNVELKNALILIMPMIKSQHKFS